MRAVLAVAILAWALAAAPEGLTLKQTLQYAIEHSPAIDLATKNQIIGHLGVTSARATMLPSFDFTTTNGVLDNLTIAGGGANLNPNSPWSSSVGLSLTENLYDNGVSLTNLKIAELNREIADVALRKAREDLSVAIAQQFYQLSLAAILISVRNQQLATIQKQFNLVAGQYQQGFKARSDYLRFRTQVQRADIAVVDAKDSLTRAEMALRQTLGILTDAPPAVTFAPETVAVDRALKGHQVFSDPPPTIEATYDAELARLQRLINDRTVDLTVRNYYPQVIGAAGVNYVNASYLNSGESFDANQQMSWNALLTINYNIWDWGIRRRAVDIARANRDVQSDTLQQGLLTVATAIRGVLADRVRLSKEYDLTRELLKLEEEAHRMLESQYRDGKTTYLDYITGFNDLLDAQVQFYTAYFGAQTLAANFKYYKGQLYDWINEASREE